MQSDFLVEFLPLLKSEGINVAIDTSGCILNEKVKKVIEFCDLVLLDYKYTNNVDYLKYTGMELYKADKFLSYLNEINKPTWIRQVIIPNINDNTESLLKLAELKNKYTCIEKLELLPFRKLCTEKYKNMNLPFPFENIREATKEDIENCKKRGRLT
jgi:pyruvate formate lyase activating enzyme